MDLLRLPTFKTKASFFRFIDARFDGSLEAFYQTLNKLSDNLIRTDLTKARRLTRKTAGLDKYLPPPYKAHLYRIWGRHHHLSSEYVQARRLYSRAIDLFSRQKDLTNRARVQKALLDVLMYLGQYDEAQRVGRQSLDYYGRIGAEVDCAQVSTNLGNLYHRLDQNKKALRYYDRAYKVFSRTKNNYASALVQFNRANAQSNLNNLSLAKKLYSEAATGYQALGMDLAACQADYSLAYLAFLEGSYSRSLQAFGEVADRFRRLGDERCLALTELDLTEVNLHLNLYSQAIFDVEAVADRFDRLGMTYERAKAFYFAAVGYFAHGDFGRVSDLAGRAAKMFRREQNKLWEIQCSFLLARMDCREGRYDRALKTLRGIASFYKRQGDVRRYYDVRLAWLEALISSGNNRAAATLIRGLDRSLREMAGYQRFVFFRLRGDCQRRKSPQKAATWYRRAVTEVQKLQATVTPDEILRFFWIDKLAVYTRLAAIYLQTGQKRKAFEIVEAGRIDTSEQRDKAVAGQLPESIPPELAEERRRLRTYLRRAMMPISSSARAVADAIGVKTAEQKLWKIERRIRRPAACEQLPETINRRGSDKVRRQPLKNEKIIHFVCREEMLGAFVVGLNSFEYVALDLSLEDVRGLLARFYFLATRIPESEADGRVMASLLSDLSKLVWQPVAAKLGSTKRLAIVPDGILSRLPFYALENADGTRLYEKYETHFLSSSSRSSALSGGGNGRRFAQSSILVAANGDLPGGTEEGRAVARRMRASRLLTGEKANRQSLFNSLGRKNSLVHLIAHAAQSYENHLFSPIVLADGPIFPFDLLSCPIKARLVVLSGCQTGDPGLFSEGHSESLAHAFVSAGAETVIASYWPIGDEITRCFMDMFYSTLADNRGVQASLNSAMTGMRNVSDDPRHWASFYILRRQ
ncbi:MAG: CHAT domain-containing protein [FCB group bacterium]|nr:CHAT domain-containing protein [FCB group bacterium]